VDKTIRQVLLALGAAAVVALAVAAWRQSGKTDAPGPAWAGAKIDWGKPARHGCDVGWMSAVLPHPHPVYRQTVPSAGRHALSTTGWAWVSNPPGEMGLADE